MKRTVLLVAALVISFAIAMLGSYVAWIVGASTEASRPVIFFSYWPAFLSALAISFAFAVGLEWDVDQDYLDFKAALAEPLEDLGFSAEDRQKFVRMRVFHAMDEAQTAARNAGQLALEDSLESLKYLYHLEAIPSIGQAREALESIVQSVELPLPPEVLEAAK